MKNTPNPAVFVSRATAWVGSVQSLVLHSLIFIGVFLLGAFNVASWDFLLLVLTTIVSLEAIYLAIFIQYTVNRQAESLREVEEDIEEIQEDVEDITEDMEDIQEDIEEIQEDVEDITEDDAQDAERKSRQKVTLEALTKNVERMLADLEDLKKGK